MITYTNEDILESTADAVVNPVNCVGISGAGLALKFAKAFPQCQRAYYKQCGKTGPGTPKMQPGTVLFVETGSDCPKYVVFFPTKNRWWLKSEYQYIEDGLLDLIFQADQLDITSIAIPALGCGLGNLDISRVEEMIIDAFSMVTFADITLYRFGKGEI